MKDLSKYYKLPLICILLQLFLSCQTQPKEQVYFGYTQGSTYSIKVISEKNEDLQESIDSLLTDFDYIFSNYNQHSLLTKVNQPITSIKVNQMFATVLNQSKEIHQLSNGFFDPTVGSLVKTWGFGSSLKKDIRKKTIDSLLLITGLDKVTLSNDLILTKKDPNVYIDFNAIAQGYTVDIVHNFLKNKGYKNYIIEIGGEIYAAGKNSIKTNHWIVAIDDPRQSDSNRTFIETIPLIDKGMATSGNYRKFIIDEDTGEKYVHTINPHTGYPQKSNILSTTVIAKTAIKADGWATAFMLLDLDKTIEIVESQNDLEAFILYLDDSNTMQRYTSKGFSN